MAKVFILASLLAITWGASIPGPNNGYIVGGRDTDISEVPYTVAMLTNGRFFCGGTIVSPNVVVTAAHCAEGKSAARLSFRAGSSDVNNGGQVAAVKSIDIFPEFDGFTMDYDVAVAVLQTPFNFSESVKAIPLVTKEPQPGQMVKVSGWGNIRESGGSPDTLQSVEVPVVDRETCEKQLKVPFPLTTRMFCAGVTGKDSCQGDSGGPLVIDNQLAGVVSFGEGCARKNKPGVYTNVANPQITEFINKFLNA
ncbi:hypothetical protein RUM43_009715 [Polyplax serrata]|uniref:Peptidase S1 domain-containing protein n=1 Tax=Polyplax serrata TaxID=468196 RepID=A0AAN8NZD9_POLSC